MKRLLVLIVALISLLAGCVVYPGYYDGYYRPYPYGYYGYVEPDLNVFFYGGHGYHDGHGYRGRSRWDDDRR
ncbi:MAG: hypothetical protein PHH28_00165 [Desulfuromonadaceae bacterium]|nr:hypothetical protein [Desulfuromonadaceae bacterium]